MADIKKYYYLKLKENFFDSEEMIILQSMQDGYLYSDILMKLYLRSLKSEGKLMFKELIPYTPNVLATVVRHQVGTVEKALKIFADLGLIDVMDNGAIYMLDIQNFIGESSTEADRIRNYRNKIKQEKLKALPECTNVQTNVRQKYTRDKDRDKDREKKKRIDYHEIVNAYNGTCVLLPQVIKITESRKKSIKSILSKYSKDELFTVFQKAQKAPFLTGENDRSWKADFDWLLIEKNMVKVLEGKYDKQKQSITQQNKVPDKYSVNKDYSGGWD